MSTSPVLVSARVQATNRNTFIYVPLLVLGASTLLTIIIWAVVRMNAPDATLFSGSVQAPYWYLLVVGAQSVALTFPFTQALSISRRDFWLGALLNFVVFSAAFAVLVWALGVVERLTDGWGNGGRMFAFPAQFEGGASLPEAGSPWYLLFYFLLGLLALSVGFAFGTVYKWGGPMALTVSIVAVVAILIGFAWLATALDWWPTILGWFPVQTLALNIVCIIAAISALAILVSWVLVRRLPA